MSKYIMVGADVHDKTMLLKIAADRSTPSMRSFANTPCGRRAMIRHLTARAAEGGAEQIVFAYEASSAGFGLRDMLQDAGIDCRVLAPTKIARSPGHRRRKTDERDAEAMLAIVRGHILAGNDLPDIWVPDAETRDDREIIRARLDAAEKVTAVKAQIRMLLKRADLRRPACAGKGWTRAFRAWLLGTATSRQSAGHGIRTALASLLRQLAALEAEVGVLDEQVEGLAGTLRYAEPAHALMKIPGVGLLTAMVFLAEMGNLDRFGNRRHVGAYLGLTPSSHESGDSGERKGHITHQGPWRVRRVLCQATWARVRTDADEKAFYRRVADRNPGHAKIAVVASMRRLAVLMWHIGREAQDRGACFADAAQVAAA